MRQVKSLAQKITLLLLLFSLITLCGCRGGKNSGEEMALKIRTSLLEATALQITAVVTADYGERVYDFTIKYAGNADSGVIEILAPAVIAGLTATVDVSGATLSYDGAELDTGAVTQDGLSPAGALPVLISQWQTGYISCCNFEKLDDRDTLAVTTAITETVSQKTWFDVESQLPLRAELSDSGKMVIVCQIDSVNLTLSD